MTQKCENFKKIGNATNIKNQLKTKRKHILNIISLRCWVPRGSRKKNRDFNIYSKIENGYVLNQFNDRTEFSRQFVCNSGVISDPLT